MKVLVLCGSKQFFGGAERMLAYILSTQTSDPVFYGAFAEESRLREICQNNPAIPPSLHSDRLQPIRLLRESRKLAGWARSRGVQVVHGWTARDWEFAVLVGRMASCPSVGTLHDHPRSYYVSSMRRCLMKVSASWGLSRIVCVSEAVRTACMQANYPEGKLEVIRNGLPWIPNAKLSAESRSGCVRIGFLGTWTEGKGLDLFLHMLGAVERKGVSNWEAKVGGGVQTQLDRPWLQETLSRFRERPWWKRVYWVGWVKEAQEFLQDLDILVFPSRGFDSFPTVLLEAGWSGLPVVAAEVGGASEIVKHQITGMLFSRENWTEGADRLSELVVDRMKRKQQGQAARLWMEKNFGIDKMIAEYSRLYSTLAQNV